MKKHILAVSIAGAFGAASMMAATAHAAVTVAENGIGHINIVPYFTSQGNNVTQIHVINTDTVNGKAVKVRFRGAEWSDDIYDFTVFLSPTDVFTGAVKVNASGVTAFETSDNSCTHTINVNKAFPTARLSGGAAAGTREGYVEVITMGNIPPTLGTNGFTGTNPLFTAIKHVKQSDGSMKPPCRTATTGASFDMFKSDDTSTLLPNVDTAIAGGSTIQNVSGSNAYGNINETQSAYITAPTASLTTWSRVIDVVDVKSYNTTATALNLGTATRVAFFTQSVSAVVANPTMTQDQIFFAKSTATGTKVTATGGTTLTDMYLYDMPDLSTPIVANQLADTVTALAKQAVISEYVTASDVGGATDIVLNQPLRRYFYTYQSCDTAASCVTEGTDYSRLISKAGTSSKYIVTGETSTAYEGITKSNRLAMEGLQSNFRPSSLSTSSAVVVYDREEKFEAAQSSIVVSPQEPTVTSLSLKGEVSVISINLGSSATETKAIGAKLSNSDISQTGYDRGWLALSTNAKGVTTSGSSWKAIPLIGFTALQVSGSFKYGNAVPIRWYANSGS